MNDPQTITAGNKSAEELQKYLQGLAPLIQCFKEIEAETREEQKFWEKSSCSRFRPFDGQFPPPRMEMIRKEDHDAAMAAQAEKWNRKACVAGVKAMQAVVMSQVLIENENFGNSWGMAHIDNLQACMSYCETMIGRCYLVLRSLADRGVEFTDDENWHAVGVMSYVNLCGLGAALAGAENHVGNPDDYKPEH